MGKKKKENKDLEVVDLTTMEYPTSDIIKIEEVTEENKEKQEEVTEIEDSLEIYGELEG